MSLKPCPFCGSEAEYFILGYPGMSLRHGENGENIRLSTFVVRCKNCKSMTPGGIFIDNGKDFPDEELAVAERHWNRRSHT